MEVATGINCETSKIMQRESRLWVNVDKAVGVVSLLGLVIQSHPSVFAIRHVNVVYEACNFSDGIVSNIPGVAVLQPH